MTTDNSTSNSLKLKTEEMSNLTETAVEVMPGLLVELKAKDGNAFTQVGISPSEISSQNAQTSTIDVTYNGFTPQAQAAFQYAVDIWEGLIESNVTIDIVANFTTLGAGVLGSAGSAYIIRDFSGAPQANTWYPAALGNKLAGTDLVTNSPDITTNFNSNFSNWYFGTDGNTPAGQYDFVSVVLHELGHGLGFSGLMGYNNGEGSWGSSGYPGIYDRFTVNGSNQSLINTSLFPNPSTALGNQLTSNNLFFNGSNAVVANGGTKPKLYAPNSWQGGSSYSHLDEATYAAGNPNSLMTPQIGTAEAIHDPGAITLGIFEDMGWTINNQPSLGEISGIKWNDLDGDGVRDSGEAGLQGWTIYLDQNQNSQLDSAERSTITDTNGNYSFTNLAAGTYRVAEVLQSGWQQTFPTSDTHTVNLAAGQIVTDINFGNRLINSNSSEPNDTIPQAISSGLNGTGSYFSTGFIGDNPNVTASDDVDFIKFYLNAGQQVTIDIDAKENGSSLDSILRVFDSAGNQVASSDDTPAPGESFTFDSFIDFTASVDDTYYVGVSSFSNFSYNPFSEGSGSGGSTGNYDIAIVVEDDFIGETGSISNLTHTARTINLSRNYQNPVIFAQPLSYNGAAPATVRLDNITNNSFTVSVQEPNNEDGTHAGENLSFMVLEAGTWQLADGTKLQVGTTDSNQLVSQGWETVNFNADFDSNPVVMSQIQTFNGADFVRTRQRNIGANGFQVGMEEEEANQFSGHTNETIGYMAMSGGSGNWSGLNYTAGYSGDRITDAWGTVNFGAGFTQTPQILASLATYDGADPAGIRRRSLNNNQVQFKVEEDTSADAEMTHTSENVSFLAIEGSGLLSASPLNSTTAMGETGSISNLTHTARTINLSRNYQNPVIFAQPLSYNGAAPATVRLDNITNNSFTVSVQEPNNEDGTHAGENLSFMVLEAGTWQLADGTKLQVGTTDSNQLVSQGWETVNFNADFDSNPVVMSQIQTFNGADFVRTRQRNIGANGFQVGMEEEEANQFSGHTNETIGYMAMSGGSGNWSGLNYTAGYSGDRITDAWGTVNFGAGFTQTPQILASLATYDGADPAGIRRRSLNNNQVQFKVEEDTSADAEMAHTTENVSFLAIEGSGILSAVSIDPLAPMAQESPVLAGVQTLNATSSPDTFILGDASQSYYDNMGIQDYALIINFDSSEDVIQLHGSASDYQLGAAPEEVPQGTGIFLNNDELVGVVSGVSDLALDADYFSFV